MGLFGYHLAKGTKGIEIFKKNVEKINKIVSNGSNKREDKDKTSLTGELKHSKKFMIKLVLIGDAAVGKTSIRKRYLGKAFPTEHLATLGADFAVKEAVVSGYDIKFQIWDIAGQEFFKNVRSRFYRGCFGALLVFDITRRETFLNLPQWLDELYRYNGRGIVPVIVLSNKSDLKDKQVTKAEVKEYIDKINKETSPEGVENFFLETSAKTGLNIDKAFSIIGEYIISKYAST